LEDKVGEDEKLHDLLTFVYLMEVKYQGNGENYIMRSLIICTPYPILCGW
jgi:hypothetical protein